MEELADEPLLLEASPAWYRQRLLRPTMAAAA